MLESGAADPFSSASEAGGIRSARKLGVFHLYAARFVSKIRLAEASYLVSDGQWAGDEP